MDRSRLKQVKELALNPSGISDLLDALESVEKLILQGEPFIEEDVHNNYNEPSYQKWLDAMAEKIEALKGE